MTARVLLLSLLVWGAQIMTDTPPPDALSASPSGVSARFTASRLSPLTGEPFDLTLTVQLPPDILLMEYPEFPAEWGRFEVVTVGDLTEEIRPDGSRLYRQTLTVRLWRPRDYTTPDTFIGYGFGGAEVFRVPVRPEFITVPTVLDFNDQTLRPLRPLVDLFYVPLWLIVGLVALVGGGAGYAFRRWRHRRSLPPVEPLDAPLPPLTQADLSLRALDPARLPPPEVLTSAAQILRQTLSAHLAIPARDLTTAELVVALSGSIKPEQLTMLERLLTEADLVKFAGKPTTPELAARYVSVASQWVGDLATVPAAQPTTEDAGE